MVKEKKGKGKKTDSTTPTSNICDNFSGDPGDPVQWQGVPASCTISRVTSGYPELTFPFTPAQGPNGSYSMSLPTLTTIRTGSTPEAGTYDFNASCCSARGSRALRELPLTPAVHPRARGFQSKPSAPAI
jgi:hypothetical protein